MAEHGVGVEAAIPEGMRARAEAFTARGGEVYQKAQARLRGLKPSVPNPLPFLAEGYRPPKDLARGGR